MLQNGKIWMAQGDNPCYLLLNQANRHGLIAGASGTGKTVTLKNGETLSARAVILATGAAPRELGLPGEQALRGRGVSYCAACDGAFFRDKTVAIVGGGDTAAADALVLSRLCKRVVLVHRRDSLRE